MGLGGAVRGERRDRGGARRERSASAEGGQVAEPRRGVHLASALPYKIR